MIRLPEYCRWDARAIGVSLPTTQPAAPRASLAVEGQGLRGREGNLREPGLLCRRGEPVTRGEVRKNRSTRQWGTPSKAAMRLSRPPLEAAHGTTARRICLGRAQYCRGNVGRDPLPLRTRGRIGAPSRSTRTWSPRRQGVCLRRTPQRRPPGRAPGASHFVRMPSITPA